MLRLAALFGLLGLVATTAIIISSGYAQILQALRQAGFGIIITSLYHVVPMILCVFGWQALMPGKNRPSIPFFLYILWLRSSVNNLMPVARIGGEIVAVRVMMKHGIRQTSAVASTVVELTLSVVGMFSFQCHRHRYVRSPCGFGSAGLEACGGVTVRLAHSLPFSLLFSASASLVSSIKYSLACSASAGQSSRVLPRVSTAPCMRCIGAKNVCLSVVYCN